jgi:alanyl-tRNA synthetase
MARGGPADLSEQVREVMGIQYIAVELPGQDAEGLREAADRMKDMIGSGVVLLATREEGKAFLVVRVTKDMMKKLPAGELVKRLAPIVGGGGGGRPDMAQAGGKNPGALPELLDTVPEVIREMAT